MRSSCLVVCFSLLSFFLLVPFTFTCAHAPSFSSSFQQRLNRWISCLLTASHPSLPSLTVAVVLHNETIYAKGFGYRDDHQTIAVDEFTLFGVGSVTKAFTAAWSLVALASKEMVEVEEVLTRPFFRYQPPVKVHVQDGCIESAGSLVDLYSHRTGLQRGDFSWIVNTNFTAAKSVDWHYNTQVVAPVLPAAISFRDSFLYNNYMYAKGAEVVEYVTGLQWSSDIQTRLLHPLGMKASTTSHRQARMTDNYAASWRIDPKNRSKVILLPTEVDDIIDSVQPAGSIHSNAVEMAEWIKAQLGQRPDVLSLAVLESTHRTRIWEQNSEIFLSGNRTDRSLFGVGLGYALGWSRETINGRSILSHSGATLGAFTLLNIWPLDDVGVFISSPAISLEVHANIMLWIQYELMDSFNWVDLMCGNNEQLSAEAEYNIKVARISRKEYEKRVTERHHTFETPWFKVDRSGLDPFLNSLLTAPFENNNLVTHSLIPQEINPQNFVGEFKEAAWGKVEVEQTYNDSAPLIATYGMLRMLLRLSRDQPAPESNLVSFDATTMNTDGLQILFAGEEEVVVFVINSDTVEAVALRLDYPNSLIFKRVGQAIASSSSSTGGASSSGGSDGSSDGTSSQSAFSSVSVSIIIALIVALVAVVAYATYVTGKLRKVGGDNSIGMLNRGNGNGNDLNTALL